MAPKRGAGPDWDTIERARIARAREQYRHTTPGERLEWALARRRRTPSDGTGRTHR